MLEGELVEAGSRSIGLKSTNDQLKHNLKERDSEIQTLQTQKSELQVWLASLQSQLKLVNARV